MLNKLKNFSLSVLIFLGLVHSVDFMFYQYQEFSKPTYTAEQCDYVVNQKNLDAIELAENKKTRK